MHLVLAGLSAQTVTDLVMNFSGIMSLAIVVFEVIGYGVLHIALMSTHLKVLHSIVVAIAVDMVNLQLGVPIIEEMCCHNAVYGELLSVAILV